MSGLRHSRRVAALLAIGPLLHLLAPGASSAPSNLESARQQALLRRAELKRNPFLGTAVELRLESVDQASGGEVRRSAYLMITHRDDRTLLLPLASDMEEQAALLLADDTYHLLPPETDQVIKLPMRPVVAGDLSHLGFLRTNLRIRCDLSTVDESTLGGRRVWLLELASRDETLPFRTVRYWVSPEDGRPLLIEYLGEQAALLKTLRFLDWQPTGLGEAPLELELVDAARPEEVTRVHVSRPLRVDTRSLAFDESTLHALRASARRRVGGGPLNPVELVQELRPVAESTGVPSP